jgi:hypothetical protein
MFMSLPERLRVVADIALESVTPAQSADGDGFSPGISERQSYAALPTPVFTEPQNMANSSINPRRFSNASPRR